MLCLQDLGQCGLNNLSLGKKEKGPVDGVLYKVTYLNQELHIKIITSNLSVIVSGGLALFTCNVDQKVEFFFDQLDMHVNASIPSITEGRLCATSCCPEIWQAYASRHKNQKWELQICVESVYDTNVGRTLINHMEKILSC